MEAAKTFTGYKFHRGASCNRHPRGSVLPAIGGAAGSLPWGYLITEAPVPWLAGARGELNTRTSLQGSRPLRVRFSQAESVGDVALRQAEWPVRGWPRRTTVPAVQLRHRAVYGALL